MGVYLHPSLCLRRKPLPLPSVSLCPLYSVVYSGTVRLRAIALSLHLCLRPMFILAKSRDLPTATYFLYTPVDGNSGLLGNVGAHVPDLRLHIPGDVRLAVEAGPNTRVGILILATLL